MKRIPAPSSPTRRTSSPPVSDSGGEKHDVVADPLKTKGEQKKPEFSKVLANQLMNMDPRNLKWMWTGLTFGKGEAPRSTAPPAPAAVFPTAGDTDTQPAEDTQDVSRSSKEVEVDAESLQDAMASENVHRPSAGGTPAGTSPIPFAKSLTEDSSPPAIDAIQTLEKVTEVVVTGEVDAVAADQHTTAHDKEVTARNPDNPHEADAESETRADPLISSPRAASPQETMPVFTYTTVFLSEADSPVETARRRVYHLTVSVKLSVHVNLLTALRRGGEARLHL